MLLTGSRDNIANAVSKKGILFGDVVVVNAEIFDWMKKALEQIAEYEGIPCSRDKGIWMDMQDIARDALKVMDKGVPTDKNPANAETCGVAK